MSNNRTLWILVADGARARIVVPEAAEGRFRTFLRLGTAEYPHVPPPMHDAGRGCHPHSFAAEVAERLNEEARFGAFGQLVLVAPGHVVHDIRAKLNQNAAACVAATVMRDFSRLNDHDLSPHLAKWWLEPAETV